MKHSYGHIIILYCLFFAITCFVLSGCDKFTRYKIATFFFTGVPHPDKTAELSLTEVTKRDIITKRKKREKSSASSHGPYASKRCFLCHETTSTRGLVKSDLKQPVASPPAQRFDSALPGRLLMPPRQLCFECHPSKSMESAVKANLWIHGPVADGMCTICHSPHASSYPFMLRQGNAAEICSRCHAKGFIMPTEDHLQGEECTKCHNAHLGKNRFLLKKDFTEIY